MSFAVSSCDATPARIRSAQEETSTYTEVGSADEEDTEGRRRSVRDVVSHFEKVSRSPFSVGTTNMSEGSGGDRLVPTFAEEVGGHLDDTGNLWAFQCVQNCQAVLNRMGFHMKEVSHEASAKTTRMNVFPVESQAGPSNYLVSLRMPHGRI
eukprot:symbB.v1.2.004826.t1/scaffold279.1/size242841/11